MTARSTISFMLLLALTALVVVLAGRRYAQRVDRLESDRTSLASVRQEAQHIEHLQRQQQRIAVRKRPEEDVLAWINDILAATEIPADHFVSLRPESDVPLAGGASGDVTYRRQNLRLALRRMSVGQLGDFLAEWPQRQDLWIPVRIDLVHAQGSGDTDRYDLTIVMTAVYIAES